MASEPTPANGEDAPYLDVLAKRMRRDSEHWFPKWHDGTLPLPIAYSLGLAGEVGEVCNEVKKMHRDGRSDGEGLGPELADVLTYLLLLADDLGIDLAQEYEAKRLVNMGRWGSPEGNHTFGTVPIGYVVHGSGRVISKTEEDKHGRLYVTFDRTGTGGDIPLDAPGWRPGCNEWTSGVRASDVCPVGIGPRGLVYPPRKVVVSGRSAEP